MNEVRRLDFYRPTSRSGEIALLAPPPAGEATEPADTLTPSLWDQPGTLIETEGGTQVFDLGNGRC